MSDINAQTSIKYVTESPIPILFGDYQYHSSKPMGRNVLEKHTALSGISKNRNIQSNLAAVQAKATLNVFENISSKSQVTATRLHSDFGKMKAIFSYENSLVKQKLDHEI